MGFTPTIRKNGVTYYSEGYVEALLIIERDKLKRGGLKWNVQNQIAIINFIEMIW